MALILGIETSTKVCSVALSNENGLLAIKEEGGEYSHAEKLNGFINSVLAEADVKSDQLDAIAVSMGPGSYTGLRIGVSTAKGLCYALNKPLIAIPTLMSMAYRAAKEDGGFDLYCPMVDARRMEVYTALYDGENNEHQAVTAKIIDSDSFKSILSVKKVVFFGDGADKCQETLGHSKNARVTAIGNPSARYINELAKTKYLRQEFEDVAYFEPYYLKDFIATTPKKLL